ncbi:hypothetical protein D9M72_602960 [compost metagenome]
MLDHFLLSAAKGGIAIDALQHIERRRAGVVEEMAGSACAALGPFDKLHHVSFTGITACNHRKM